MAPSQRLVDALADLTSVVAAVSPADRRGYAQQLLDASGEIADWSESLAAGQLTGARWSAVVMAHVAALLEASADDPSQL